MLLHRTTRTFAVASDDFLHQGDVILVDDIELFAGTSML
jgi:hypothetical protein